MRRDSEDHDETIGEHMSNYERRMKNRDRSTTINISSSRSDNDSDNTNTNSRSDSDSTSSSTTISTDSGVIIKPSPGNTVQTEHWFVSYWRPAAAWVYLTICVFDFMGGPIFYAWYSYATKASLVRWEPLTTSGGSIFHLAFGAIVGIYVYGRTREKLAGLTDQ